MLDALDHIFRPIARLAILRRVRFADVAERLRRAFLSEARGQLGEAAPVSRLAVMTGLQRRDITRLIEAREAAPSAAPDPLARLVAAWRAQYGGAPLPHHGDAGSFDALARTIRQDVHPRSLLDMLVAAGTVERRGQQVHLLRTGHVPQPGSEAQLRYLGANVGDHLAVAVGNVAGDPPGFDLAVHYGGLSEAAVAELEALWRGRMRAVLEEVNARAAALQAAQEGPARFRAGGYFRKEAET
jgi:hypothetical protein